MKVYSVILLLFVLFSTKSELETISWVKLYTKSRCEGDNIAFDFGRCYPEEGFFWKYDIKSVGLYSGAVYYYVSFFAYEKCDVQSSYFNMKSGCNEIGYVTIIGNTTYNSYEYN